MKKKLLAYNDGLEKPTSNSFNVKFGLNENGLGITMKFCQLAKLILLNNNDKKLLKQ